MTDLGGVCLNRGCIPSKALLHIAQIIEEANELEAKGVKFGTPKIDIDKIREWKEEVVGKLNKGIAQMAKARKVSVYNGIGEFVSDSEIVIKNDNKKEKISFDNAIIATGSRSTVIPSFSNGQHSHHDIQRSITIGKHSKNITCCWWWVYWTGNGDCL